MSEQAPSKEKLPDWLRRWYALKGEPRFREAADEIERLERELYLLRNERDNLADNVHRLTLEPSPVLGEFWAVLAKDGSLLLGPDADPYLFTRKGEFADHNAVAKGRSITRVEVRLALTKGDSQ